ncbi:MAG: bifunctional (p)ppGpp synthetase/guanosine-3',5'-bis(diphosphate) 3'-pyrophosphohydrolase [Anaerolineales bacterium]|nr:bifunctional (p)ppGpp synthetase/guanosine-3',5'-bis(diphosphate) 3'-pyrophosphohydrolase [Anaerolineales bacterium]
MNEISNWSDTAIQIITQEADKYMPFGKSIALKLGYDLIMKYSASKIGQSRWELSLESTLHVTELGFNIEFLTSTLLYYSFLDGTIPENELIIFGPGVNYHLQALLSLDINLESYLPWVQAYLNAHNFPIYDDNKKQYWINKNREARPNAFLGMAPTPEIAVIKLVERLYLLKELANFNFPNQLANTIASESLELHALIAEMLGVWTIKWKTEDYAFKVLHPNIYHNIVRDIAEHRQKREARVDRAISIISARLAENNINAKVVGRVKHIYGLYQKVKKTRKSVQEINDSLAIRIIVNPDISEKIIYEPQIINQRSEINDEQLCYQTRDILFNTWEPAIGIYEENSSIRDYISKPKENGYQSIHTTVIFEGKLLEVQIRSQTMHDLAEYGAAAHWIYKKTGKTVSLSKKYQNYVDRLAKYRQIFETGNKSVKGKM